MDLIFEREAHIFTSMSSVWRAMATPTPKNKQTKETNKNTFCGHSSGNNNWSHYGVCATMLFIYFILLFKIF